MENNKPISLEPEPSPVAFDSLIKNFYNHFKLVIANTNRLREEVYKIRYKVYCQELKYEKEENCWNGMEQDIYDHRSVHCLLMHRSSQVYAGCVRVILADPDASKASHLPLEKVFCRSLKPHNLPHYFYGEVSRLAVIAEFRKRQEEKQLMPVADTGIRFTEQERRYFPLITTGLYLTAASVSLEVGLDSAFTVMEPRLARYLRRFGIKFRQIGGLIEFHGQRGLFQISRSAVLSSVNAHTYELFQTLRCEVKRSLIQSAPGLLGYKAAGMSTLEPLAYYSPLYGQFAGL
ncbi:MAG: PEP-CTERM/exosortase system-associated acyltransferase [Chroococcidiopsidaceae cyanobacterium CP_BM_ER_R8_30]|nr:PEP-CTERM/exosortase system-associated acyltransferase [Chroococcidiopsidaceae cyanobacterium CP_BM_ER_R8_30]